MSLFLLAWDFEKKNTPKTTNGFWLFWQCYLWLSWISWNSFSLQHWKCKFLFVTVLTFKASWSSADASRTKLLEPMRGLVSSMFFLWGPPPPHFSTLCISPVPLFPTHSVASFFLESPASLSTVQKCPKHWVYIQSDKFNFLAFSGQLRWKTC